MARTVTKPGRAKSRDRIESLGSVADSFAAGGWRPAREVLVEVQAVPTIFPQIDAVTKVDGWPIARVALVHGPSNNGKTELCHGIGLSFLRRKHFYAFVDAEYSTPARWLRTLMREQANNPWFLAMRPESYEQTVDAVRFFCKGVEEKRKAGAIHPDTSAFICVDSIKKLVPKRLLDSLLKEGADADDKKFGKRKKKAGGIDGMAGRAAMYKAALNSQWLDELIPMLAHTNTSMAIIAREMEDPDADVFSSKDWKTGGGKALFYDSGIDVRVLRESAVRDDDAVYGERHRVEVHKTKIGAKEEVIPSGHYHTANGVLDGFEGFDIARDLLEMAEDRGVVSASGSWLSFEKERIGNGKHAAVKRLHADAALLERLDAAVRETFPKVNAA